MLNEPVLSEKTIVTFCDYRDYVISQGGEGLSEVANICVFYKPLFEISCILFPTLAKVFSDQKLMTVSSAEQIIDRGLRDGMSKKKYYKDIYKDVKSRVMIFADLHGQSNVITKQLKDNR